MLRHADKQLAVTVVAGACNDDYIQYRTLLYSNTRVDSPPVQPFTMVLAHGNWEYEAALLASHHNTSLKPLP
jgi:hypothetical protein